jgi:hypothetical protein
VDKPGDAGEGLHIKVFSLGRLFCPDGDVCMPVAPTGRVQGGGHRGTRKSPPACTTTALLDLMLWDLHRGLGVVTEKTLRSGEESRVRSMAHSRTTTLQTGSATFA